MTTTTQTKKEQYATCEECERYCYTGGEHKEGEEYICEDCEEEECCRDCGGEVGECDCDYGNPELARLRDGEEEEEEFDVDDRDAPNILPYKKCSVCGERKSCGNYRENDWFCENCAEEAEEEEELAYDCEVCKKHLYITDMAKCDWRELCCECCVGRQEDCDCPVCVDNNTDENVAQFTAFVQANFTREELFPETKPIATSDSISGEVSRELETLQAQNAKLVAENQRLQQQLVAIQSVLKSLLSSN